MKTPTPHSAPSRCRVTCVKNSRAPWRVYFTGERKGTLRRQYRSFSSEEKARRFAAETEAAIAEHGLQVGTLPPEVRRAYQAFRAAESKLTAKGINLPDFEQFVKNSLSALDREADSMKLTVAEAIERFLEFRKSRLKAATYQSLRLRLRRFARSLGDRPIQSISPHDFESWWTELPRERRPALSHNQPTPIGLSAFAKNHSRAALMSLFRHALKHEWITTNPIAAIQPEEVEPAGAATPRVHSPEKVADIMQAALTYRPEIIPALALQLFAGLRIKEAAKIELSDLLAAKTIASGSFALPGSRTDGKERRFPVTKTLLAWLHAQPRNTGPSWQSQLRVLNTRIQEVLGISGTDLPISSLRNTYFRYRLAQNGDALGLMEEGEIRIHLVRLLAQLPATREDAENYFSILPTTTH